MCKVSDQTWYLQIRNTKGLGSGSKLDQDVLAIYRMYSMCNQCSLISWLSWITMGNTQCTIMCNTCLRLQPLSSLHSLTSKSSGLLVAFSKDPLQIFCYSNNLVLRFHNFKRLRRDKLRTRVVKINTEGAKIQGSVFVNCRGSNRKCS